MTSTVSVVTVDALAAAFAHERVSTATRLEVRLRDRAHHSLQAAFVRYQGRFVLVLQESVLIAIQEAWLGTVALPEFGLLGQRPKLSKSVGVQHWPTAAELQCTFDAVDLLIGEHKLHLGDSTVTIYHPVTNNFVPLQAIEVEATGRRIWFDLPEDVEAAVGQARGKYLAKLMQSWAG